MPLHPFRGQWPQIDPTSYVAAGAQVIGDVTLGPRTSVWFNAVLRGDANSIRIGAGTNIQDGAVVHADADPYDTVVGEECVVGHRAIIHGCKIGNRCLIGMGAIVLNGARLGDGCLVAAGALVPENKEFPPRSLLMGVPARVVRQLTEAEVEQLIRSGATHYMERAVEYAASDRERHGEQP